LVLAVSVANEPGQHLV